MIGIHSWVRPNGGPDDGELIVGRVCAIPVDEHTDILVSWLSNERGLWLNREYLGDLAEIETPPIGVIEAILVAAVPNLPFGHEA